MAGNVYSNYELAREMANERMQELETDIFICRSQFKSGEEFTLKTRYEMGRCTNYIYHLELPFRFHFKNKKNADRESEVFASKKGRPVYFNRKTNIESGYVVTKYFYLTYKEPCLI